nr:retrovirus-related Pol polyprotein from transposon TNT 1-94 [Tanacetum cinerariifolium]
MLHKPRSYFSNSTHSIVKRPINNITTSKNSKINHKVNTVIATHVNTARPKVNTARPKAVLNAVKGNHVNAVKASTCCVWRANHKVLDNVSRNNNPSITFKRFNYGNSKQDLKDKRVINSGCSRHMTGNRSYFMDYKEINGGFVAFGGNSRGGKITKKSKIRTDFKLTEESHVLLIVPRKDNVYSVDLKNVVPQGGRKSALSFMRPFGCLVTILNTIDHLGKFDGKANEGFFVGYFTNSKAFRVFKSRTRIVEENMHVKFSENTPNITGIGPNWLFDIDALTNSLNYKPVVAGNQSNGSAGTKACNIIGKSRVETVPDKDYILVPLWTQDPPFSSSSKDSLGAGYKPSGEEEKKDTEDPRNEDS